MGHMPMIWTICKIAIKLSRRLGYVNPEVCSVDRVMLEVLFHFTHILNF